MLLAHWWRQDGRKAILHAWPDLDLCTHITGSYARLCCIDLGWLTVLNKKKVGGVVVWWCGDAGLGEGAEEVPMRHC